MGTVGFTNKKTIRPDTTWFQPHCIKCPYLAKDDIKQVAMCYRPFGEDCLAEGILVEAVLLIEKYHKLTQHMDTLSKKIYRRRK